MLEDCPALLSVEDSATGLEVGRGALTGRARLLTVRPREGEILTGRWRMGRREGEGSVSGIWLEQVPAVRGSIVIVSRWE